MVDTKNDAKPTQYKRNRMSMSSRKRLIRIFAVTVMVLYTVLTLFPFYTLFIRSFVSTKDSTDLHLWIPEADEVNMSAQVGNLGVFYDLDLKDLKEALGIPQTEFIMARTSLPQVSETIQYPGRGDQGISLPVFTHTMAGKRFCQGTLYGTMRWALRTLLVTGHKPDDWHHPVDLHRLWFGGTKTARPDVCVQHLSPADGDSGHADPASPIPDRAMGVQVDPRLR